MFEMMSIGFNSPVNASMSYVADIALPGLPTNVAANYIGKADNDDLVTTAATGIPSIWIHRKDVDGSWKLLQTINNVTFSPNAGAPTPISGGFMIASPSKPNNRGSLSLFKRQADGTYTETPQTVRETGDIYGSIGGYGGIAASGDWLFGSVQFNGSFLMCFKKGIAGDYPLRQKIQMPGSSLFAAQSVRIINGDTMLCSANNETSGGKIYAGAVYQFKLNPVTDLWEQVTRLQAFAPTENGYFGSSITAMDPLNVIATSRSGTWTAFHHLQRETTADAFKWISSTTTPVGVNPYQGNNAQQGGGKMLFCGNRGKSGDYGDTIVCTFNKATGVIAYKPGLVFSGKDSGEFFAADQVVIGNEVIFISTMAGAASKSSKLVVYKYTVPE